MPEVRVRVSKNLHNKLKVWKEKLGFGTYAALVREAVRYYLYEKQKILSKE